MDSREGEKLDWTMEEEADGVRLCLSNKGVGHLKYKHCSVFFPPLLTSKRLGSLEHEDLTLGPRNGKKIGGVREERVRRVKVGRE